MFRDYLLHLFELIDLNYLYYFLYLTEYLVLELLFPIEHNVC